MLDEAVTRRGAARRGASRLSAWSGASAPLASPATLTKHVTVQRSRHDASLSWWSLPLRLRDAGMLHAGELAGARAVVHPASALGDDAATLGATGWPGGTARVADVRALFEARDARRVGPCTIAVFPATVPDQEVEPRMTRFRDDLEQFGFAFAVIPDGDDRHRFCFRVPGKVIHALECLAHGRGFGDHAEHVERALLGGLQLHPDQVARLRLVLREGGARLVGEVASGRRRITYLESNQGYTGTFEDRSRREVAGERAREAWRRFPLGVVMLVGLPFFIATFWIHSLLTRRGALDAVVPAAGREASAAIRARTSSATHAATTLVKQAVAGRTRATTRVSIPQHSQGSATCAESES